MKSLNTSLITKAIDVALAELRKEENHNTVGQVTYDMELLWEIKKYEELKESLNYFKNINSISILNEHGGSWLGTVRNFIQRKFSNGEDVTWGSHDYLKPRNTLTVSDYEHLASEIAANAIREVFGER